MVEEESDDAEAVVKLLELNDAINTIIEKYTLVRKGDIDAARALPTVTPYTPAASAAKPAVVEDSLIDLGGDMDPTNGSSSSPGPSNSSSLQTDLLGLSIEDPGPTFGQGGGIALGFGANTSTCSRCSLGLGFGLRFCIRYTRPAIVVVHNAGKYGRTTTLVAIALAAAARRNSRPPDCVYVPVRHRAAAAKSAFCACNGR